MKRILCLITGRLAHEGEPHLPQTVLFADYEYDVPSEVCEKHADRAVELGMAEYVDVEEGVSLNDVPFEELFAALDAATKEEMKDFVKSNEDMDKVINLSAGEEKLRESIKVYLELDKED